MHEFSFPRFVHQRQDVIPDHSDDLDTETFVSLFVGFVVCWESTPEVVRRFRLFCFSVSTDVLAYCLCECNLHRTLSIPQEDCKVVALFAFRFMPHMQWRASQLRVNVRFR